MADNSAIVPTDSVDAALQKAKLEAKRQRIDKIGGLIDKAVDVLNEVLDDSSVGNTRYRMEAASLAVTLYTQQDNGERQDKALELQERRLDLEEAKLKMPGGPLFQQTNVYLDPQVPRDPQLLEIEKEALLKRKQAQAAILNSYLSPVPTEAVQLNDTDTGDNTDI